MKLDTKYLRYLTNEDWRVLAAVSNPGSHWAEVAAMTDEHVAGFLAAAHEVLAGIAA